MIAVFLSYWSKGTIKAVWEAMHDRQVSKSRIIIYRYVHLPSEIPFEWVMDTLTLVVIIKGMNGSQTQYCSLDFLCSQENDILEKGSSFNIT